jgi:hypothetical protein
VDSCKSRCWLCTPTLLKVSTAIRAGRRNPRANLLPMGIFSRGFECLRLRLGELVARVSLDLRRERFPIVESEDMFKLVTDSSSIEGLASMGFSFRIHIMDTEMWEWSLGLGHGSLVARGHFC